MNQKKPDYITLTISVRSAEDDCYELHEHGALGSETISDTEVRCFLPEDDKIIESIQLLCEQQGWKILSNERCVDKNWVQECTEVWQPLTVEDFSIHPLLSQTNIPPHQEKTILIVPGEGFGTGHHPSTRLAMGLLQRAQREFCPTVSKALDFGTGNGILAITTSMLWPEANIDAIDNDPSAIPNAQENLELNNKAKSVHLSVNSIENLTSSFELITANIYAEVLCKFHQDFLDRLIPGGLLILAGIMGSRAHLIRETFLDTHWQLIENRKESDWDAFLLKKIK